jgi:hypothetical protein
MSSCYQLDVDLPAHLFKSPRPKTQPRQEPKDQGTPGQEQKNDEAKITSKEYIHPIQLEILNQI